MDDPSVGPIFRVFLENRFLQPIPSENIGQIKHVWEKKDFLKNRNLKHVDPQETVGL